jgi:hypothetical protein
VVERVRSKKIITREGWSMRIEGLMLESMKSYGVTERMGE